MAAPFAWIANRVRRLALADKALLMFGGALVLIIVIAMGVAWLRMSSLVNSGELQLSRSRLDMWRSAVEVDPRTGTPDLASGVPTERLGIAATWYDAMSARAAAANDRFVRRALRRFDAGADEARGHRWVGSTKTERIERYARAIRGPAVIGPDGSTEAPGELLGLIVLRRPAEGAAWLMAINGVYLLNAGAAVLAVAVGLFYLLLHRIILRPVAVLREGAIRVGGGDLNHRVRVTTQDEFQQLAAAFNDMVQKLQANEQRLRTAGAALESRVGELAEANKVLFEANRLKSDFLANVSHELRTPLNSINGFTELLLEIARQNEAGQDETPDQRTKRLRYLGYIHTAGRDLLEMITGLLEMAKLEAGRVELRVEPVSVSSLCETLVGLAHPLAQGRGIEIDARVEPDLPLVQTDAKKLQQVLFNFLSNAVKFTGAPGSTGPMRVELRAERLVDADGGERVRVSVLDNGPGIAEEDQARVFEKFTQVDASHTREHAGTGLGLAIAKELAGLLQCELQLVSEVGRGSMFSVIVPLHLDLQVVRERRAEAQFRDRLAGRRDWFEPGAQMPAALHTNGEAADGDAESSELDSHGAPTDAMRAEPAD
ncbi:MAG: HAMP domain-containing sensor histidine kinase [Planctomycetota bacterium]